MSDIKSFTIDELKKEKKWAANRIKEIYDDFIDKNFSVINDETHPLWGMGEQECDFKKMENTCFSEVIFIKNVYSEKTIFTEIFRNVAELCYNIMMKITHIHDSKTTLMFSVICHLLKTDALDGFWLDDKLILSSRYCKFKQKNYIDPSFGFFSSWDSSFQNDMMDEIYDRVSLCAHYIEEGSS